MKIDTSTIDGYADMTAEEKLAAIESLELTGYVSKEALDKAASEAAEYKRQLKEKMTEDEAAKLKEVEEKEALQNKYNELLKKSTIAEHTAKFLALGYEEKLAHETAEALYDGNMDKVFENQQTYKASVEKSIKASILKETPAPSGTSGETVPKNIEIAKSLGAAKSEALKASEKGIENYL